MPHCLSQLRLLKPLVFFGMLFFTVNSVAADDGSFSYEIDGGNAVITGCVGTCPTDLVIPGTIDGYSVTSIGGHAFSYNQLTSVIIPDSVTKVRHYAFEGNQLTSVIIPDSVTNIRRGAFADNQLTSVIIPDRVTSIGDYAFLGNQLTSVSIGSSVTYIGNRAFENNRLTSVIIPDSVLSLGDRAFRSNHITSLTIGTNVTNISDNAFANNRLTSVVIPERVRIIGDSAFANNQLSNLIIGNSVTRIGYKAFDGNKLIGVAIPESVIKERLSVVIDSFSNNPGFTSGGLQYFLISGSAMVIGCDDNCPKNLNIPTTINGYKVTTIAEYALLSAELTSVIIPNSVITIGQFAFKGNLLSNLIIPDSVTHIGIGTFQSNQLTSLVIGNNVTSIAAYAFQGNQLSDLNIPDSVTSIGRGAFEDNQLTSVNIPDSVIFRDTVINKVDYAFFNNLGISSGAVQYFLISGQAYVTGCADVCPKNLIIPGTIEGNRVIQIGQNAFEEKQLTSVIIPDSVSSIEGDTFRGNQLTSVIIPDSVTKLGSSAFASNNLYLVQFLGDRPIISSSFSFDSLNPVTITYCSDKRGWPGGSIDGVILSDDCNRNKFNNDNDADGISNDLDTDDDNDGLLDSYEITISTNPLLVDSDFDGLSDSYEVANYINPNLADSDNDGLKDGDDYYPLTFDETSTLYSGRLIVLPDLNNDDINEVGIFKVVKDEEFITLDILNGQDQRFIKRLNWENDYIDTTVTLHIIQDMNDNGAKEVGLFGITKGYSYNQPEMIVRDLNTRLWLTRYRWPSNWKMVSVLVLDDMTGDGMEEIAIQGRFKEGNRPQLVIKTGGTDNILDTYTYPDLLVSPQYYQHSDINGDGFAEIATFGRLRTNNKVQVKLANGLDSKNKLPAYNFPNNWDNVSWHRLGDSNGDGQDDWGLFGTSRKDGRPQLVNRNGVNQEALLRKFAWPAEMQNAQFYRIPDMNNDGVDEVAAAGQRSNNGRYQLQIQDGTDRNSVLANHNLNLKLENVTYHVLPDLSGDEQVEIGFMGMNSQGEYELVIRHGDTANGEYARHNLGSDWQSTPDITSLGDTDDDSLPDLLIYGQNASGEQLVMTSL